MFCIWWMFSLRLRILVISVVVLPSSLWAATTVFMSVILVTSSRLFIVIAFVTAIFVSILTALSIALFLRLFASISCFSTPSHPLTTTICFTTSASFSSHPQTSSSMHLSKLSNFSPSSSLHWVPHYIAFISFTKSLKHLWAILLTSW